MHIVASDIDGHVFFDIVGYKYHMVFCRQLGHFRFSILDRVLGFEIGVVGLVVAPI